jgi:hypothetical protein
MIRNNKSRQVNRQNNSQSRGIPCPPPFNATLVTRKRLRFEASSASPAGGTALTSEDVFDLLCMATSATAAYQIMTGVKIRRISIWGPMAASLAPVTVSIEYLATGSFLGQPTKIKSDTSMGATRAAYVSYAPPPKSLLDNWVPSNTGVSLISLQFPANSIVDVEFDFVTQNGESPFPVGAVVAGATVGKVYCRALDSNGSGLLVPISYPTI